MNVLILGAGYGGLTAALRLARRGKGRVQVTLVNPVDVLVERIRLHERASGRRPKRHSIPTLLEGTGVRLVLGRVSEVRLSSRTVFVNGEGLPFDQLIVATGSRTDERVPGVREHAVTLDAGGAERLAGALSGRVAVVGGGLTAIELATELAEGHPELSVSLVTRTVVGPEFGEAAREYFRRTFARLKIELVEHTEVQRVEAGALVTSTGTRPFDVCAWASGFVAAPLPEGLAVSTNARGQVLADDFLRSSSHPFVWGVGDAVCSSLPFPMGCKSAGPSGAHVADNVLRTLEGQPLEAFDYHAPVFCISLGRRDGLLQRTTPDGALQGAITGGRLAAFTKELICRYTVWALTLERMGLASYSVFKPDRRAALERGREGA